MRALWSEPESRDDSDDLPYEEGACDTQVPSRGQAARAQLQSHSERWAAAAAHRVELTDLRPGDFPPRRADDLLPAVTAGRVVHDETPRVVVTWPHRASSFRALSGGTPPVRIPPRATGSPSTSITCHITKV